jgi:hypothetical protein
VKLLLALCLSGVTSAAEAGDHEMLRTVDREAACFTAEREQK